MSPSVLPSRLRERAGPATGPGEPLPLLDAAVLHHLEEQLNGPGLVRKFARDYAAMWEHRHRRLAEALEHPCDRDAALDAVISLRVSSAMIGGLRLAGLAATLEAGIRESRLPAGGTPMAAIAECGAATVDELQRLYPGET